MLSDIEIAESAELLDVREIGRKLHLSEESLEPYGKYKAKISLPKDAKRNAKLIWWRGGRRLRAGRTHVRDQPPFHGGSARDHRGKQPALRPHG